MRIQIKPLWLLLLFLCAISTAKGQGSLKTGDSLLQMGRFKEASLAFEWLVYQDANPQTVVQARLGRVEALKQLGDYQGALDILNRINILSAAQNLRGDIAYQLILMNYLNQDYQAAMARGMMMRSILHDSPQLIPALRVMSLAAIENKQWDQLKLLGQEYISSLPDGYRLDSLQAVFDSLLARPLPDLKDPEKARRWSSIIPGSGQMYAGALGDGVLNLALHLGAAGLSAWAFFSGFYVSAWLGGANVIQKLYTGGKERAFALCQEKNRLAIQEYSQPVRLFFTQSLEIG